MNFKKSWKCKSSKQQKVYWLSKKKSYLAILGLMSSMFCCKQTDDLH